jgi:hypothetical protein
VADGPTSDVIQTYLARERVKMNETRDTEVVIRSVRLRGVSGNAVRFHPGDKAWIDVEFQANRACEHIAVVLAVLDEGLSEVFNTSSERLEHRSFSLEQGQTATVTFELDMHLAVGTFHVGVYLYRYDMEREFDRVLPAATFFIESEVDVRGSANLYPKLIAGSISDGE